MARIVDNDNYIGGLTHSLLIVSKALKFFLLSLPLQYVSHSQGRPIFGGQSAGNLRIGVLTPGVLAWETKWVFPRHFVLKWPENR